MPRLALQLLYTEAWRLAQKMTLCLDKAVKVLLEQALSTHLMTVCFKPQSVLSDSRLVVTQKPSSTKK